MTRDFPWANILLFVVAAVFVFVGVKRAFSRDRGWFSKIGSSTLAFLSVLVLAGFVMIAFVSSRWMPEAKGAPQIGQKAPDFTLTDSGGKTVSLSQLLSEPIRPGSAEPKGVLLIFYRGYW